VRLYVPHYRQETTLPEAKPLVSKWEGILGKFGLAEADFGSQDLQTIIQSSKRGGSGFTTQFDYIQERSQPAPEQAHKVCTHMTPRQVPFWALSDNNLAAFILHLHPKVKTASHKSRDGYICDDARCAAARNVALMYLAWRAGWQDCDIAELMGIAEATVINRLYLLRQKGELFFAKRKIVKDVLVHNCHAAGDKQPVKCRCKLYITHDEAKTQVKQGLADWMWFYPANGKPYQSHGAVVAVRGQKTPRAAMLEKAHMERNAGGQEEQQASVEAFGVLEYLFLASLISKEIKVDAFPGMPVLPMWADQRR
jgi:hypothetical protein